MSGGSPAPHFAPGDSQPPPGRPSRLGVGIIGAGRVGPVLGLALAGAGHALVGVSTTSASGRERVRTLLPGTPILPPDEVVRRAELVLLAIPGAEIASLVGGLNALKAWQPGQLLVHTAPEFGCEVLAQATGVIPLALSPAIVFTGTSLDVARLQNALVAVTAPAVVQPIGQALVIEMGAEPLLISAEDRPHYAATLSEAAAQTAAITATAVQRLRNIGVARATQLVEDTQRAALAAAALQLGQPQEPLGPPNPSA